MFYNKKLIRIINIVLCFFVLFSTMTTVRADAGKFITDNITKIYDKLVSAITKVLLSFGDGVFHIMASAVGESVSIDKLVFNQVSKVSIDYWEDFDGTNNEQMKAFMKPVVLKWYKVFNKIAIVVYIIVLIYIGVKILLTVATPEKKAGYKEMFTSWVIGVTILFMFPYVMKYIVLINNAVVRTLDQKAEGIGSSTSQLANLTFWDVITEYGTSDFVKYVGDPKTEIMALTRNAADVGTESQIKDSATGAKVNAKEGNIALAFAYLILLGQTLAILIMYYTRAFMIAFLITIFPLVAMTYAIDKIGDGKNQSFNIWFKEFVVNVIVQMFHAVIYVLVTGSGIKSYLNSNGKNFLFMFLSILFLFEGEKILRTIFNVNSKAGTMADLAQSGALAFATAKSFGSLKRDDNKVGTAEDQKSAAAASSRIKSRKNVAKETNDAAIAELDRKSENGESLDSHGEYQGKDNEPPGVSTPRYDEQNAKDTALTKAMKRKLNSGLAVGAVNKVASFTGGTLEMTRNMAAGKTSPGDMVSSYVAGRKMGQTLSAPLAFVAGKGEQIAHGIKVSNDIKNGKMDKALGISNIPNDTPIDPNDTNLSAIENKLDSTQEIYRKALQEYAKAAAVFGENAGEIAYYNYLENNIKK